MHETTLLPCAVRRKKTRWVMCTFSVFAFIFMVPFVADAKRATPWAKYEKPSSGKSESIGKYAGGCVLGAGTLPEKATGFETIRRFRNRYHGHPVLIEFIHDYGKSLREQKLAPALIGDLSQPRGGLMGYGHRSHQIGLDADVWFSRPKRSQRDKDEFFPSLVNRKTETIIKSRLNARSIAMLRTAAEDPRVARIFVHWVIKKALCQKTFDDRNWLGKIRAWYGHDRHFHIRLKCPSGSPNCVNQRVIPPGDGCGAEVYFSRARVNKRKAKEKAAKKKRMAAAKRQPKPTFWAIFMHRTHRVAVDAGQIFHKMPISGSSGKTQPKNKGVQGKETALRDSLIPFTGHYVARVFARMVVYIPSAFAEPGTLPKQFAALPKKRPYWPKVKRMHKRCAEHILLNPRVGESGE